MTIGPMHVHHSYRALKDEVSPDSAPLTVVTTRDQAAELASQLTKLATHLDGLESLARAALPQAERVYNWAPFSLDTGLTPAQEDFVDRWSPEDVLNYCRSQRELVKVLQSWLLTHAGPADLELALALVCTCTNGLPQ